MRDVLLAALGSAVAMNRYLAAQALAQLCCVTEQTFVEETVSCVQRGLQDERGERRASSVFFFAFLRHLFLCADVTPTFDTQAILVEALQDRQPLCLVWSLQALGWFLRDVQEAEKPAVNEWVVQVLEEGLMEEVDETNSRSLQQAWVNLLFLFVSIQTPTLLEQMKEKFSLLMELLDYVSLHHRYQPQLWVQNPSTQLQQTCIKIYTALFAIAPSLPHAARAVPRIRSCLKSPVEEVRRTPSSALFPRHRHPESSEPREGGSDSSLRCAQRFQLACRASPR